MSLDRINQELSRGEAVSIINLVNNLVELSHERKASDIHIDPVPTGMRVRLRMDGVLHDFCELPKSVQSEVVSRVKVLASLRTDEHQMTQDGRFRHVLPNGNSIDVRVAIAPTYRGENVVMRLLSDNAERFSLENLGFSEANRKKIAAVIRRSSGMILVTGPTGSGKTTTLYTLIQMLNSKDVAVVTIEDPVEYEIDGVEQLQTNSRVGLNFAVGLRSVLRQDPNIIMVGEIRDSETAAISVNAALTGHLLLSTLHTNDAATTLPRLLDMKVEAFLVASTISLVIGQRLVRKICANCREKIAITESILQGLTSIPSSQSLKVGEFIYRGKGCERCGGTGYFGRLSINEVLVADEKIKNAIACRASARELKELAIKNGMTTMLEDGFAKVREGETTLEEVLRVVHE